VSARPFLGLRGRLLLALVATSALTLTAAAVALVNPLTERLRSQSIQSLRQASLDARPRFERALQVRSETARYQALQDAGLRLQGSANARVLVAGVIEPAFVYDTDIGAPVRQAQRVALRSLRLRSTVEEVDDDQASIGIRLFGQRPGVLVTERRLTDVATTVQQVRNALLAAGAIGLLVAILLAAGISSTLLRRLARLRAAALRITAEGPDAPQPEDETRDEVGDLARAFARMQEALRREEASRRSFVATASHELRTPLTMLQGTMELLEEDLRDSRVDIPDAQRQVASARRELRRLSSLAEELLDLSRLDAQVPLRSEPVELGEIARAVAAEFALRASDRGTAIDATPPADACWAIGDPDAVARVVRILLDNALRHAPAETEVRLMACADARPAIEVSDRGSGVLPQDRERIFDRFYRSAEAGAGSGFGLGLAIGRGLAERMGGTLELRSGDGAGARFVLELPAAGPVPDPPPLSAARSTA
jgi:signal transduction histidine kinase